MLCFEGISLMLNVFRGKCDAPQYTLAPPAGGQLESLTAHKEVSDRDWAELKEAKLNPYRRHKLDLLFPGRYCAISSLHKHDMSHSLLCKISCIRTLLDNGHSLQ